MASDAPDLSARPAVPPRVVDELVGRLTGSVVLPTDPEWDRARAAWNLAADQWPALIARPSNATDVVAIVEFARRNGLRVAPQCSGHNATSLGPLDGAVLVSTVALQGVAVDVEGCTVRVQGGTPWGAVTAATDEHGLFPLSGSSPDVGVVGYTLGGGLSWLARKHGLAANHVTALEVVTPDGRLVRATSTADATLFWALRGGAANFGVVTAIELALFPYGRVYAGMFVWPYQRHSEVLETWLDWTATAPDDITTSLRIIHFPPLPALPPFLSGHSVVVVDGVFAGDADAGGRAVAPLRALAPGVDTWAPCPPAALDQLHMDPPQPTAALSTTMLIGTLDRAGRQAFVGAVPPGGPLLFGELRHLGGALAHAPTDAGALGALDGEFSLYAVGVGTAADPAIVPALDAVVAAMAPYATGKAFANFAERPIDAARLYAAADYDRLRAVRAAVDPDGVMLAGHPIPPT